MDLGIHMHTFCNDVADQSSDRMPAHRFGVRTPQYPSVRSVPSIWSVPSIPSVWSISSIPSVRSIPSSWSVPSVSSGWSGCAVWELHKSGMTENEVPSALTTLGIPSMIVLQ